MKLESFKHLIQSLIESAKRDEAFYEMGLDISSISDPYHQIITHMLRVYYGKDGEEWISWFMYERRNDQEFQAWDEDENPICYDVESLWKHVEEIRVSSSFHEYVPEIPMTDEEIKNQIRKIFK